MFFVLKNESANVMRLDIREDDGGHRGVRFCSALPHVERMGTWILRVMGTRILRIMRINIDFLGGLTATCLTIILYDLYDLYDGHDYSEWIIMAIK
jgi:hypothetical protein